MAVAAVRYFETRARLYRRTWHGSVITTFLSPVLYLAAMGAGLGTLVDDGAGRSAVAGFSYLAFLAPGLLAATTMQAGANDGSWPVMAGIRWAKTYEATLSTPIAVRDLVFGHLLWAATRGGFVALVFASVMALFGAVSLDHALLAVLPALLTGIAFTAPTMAYTATLRDVQGLISLTRFGVIPMFLFSGTFFPVTQLPEWIRPIAYATPLWHGVELTRAAALGIGTTWPPLAHIGYLAAWFAVGVMLAVRLLGRRMRS
jgi:lipooligosaccharide transport system permease protein